MRAAAASRHQSQKGRENIPATGTNRRRGERIYPQREPIAKGEREYTRSGHQSQKGRENIPAAGTNHRRGENIPAAGTNRRRGENILYSPDQAKSSPLQPQIQRNFTLFYGSSGANNGKDALNTPRNP
eukprot:1195523-Prorocentrum_minimum.AAC.3